MVQAHALGALPVPASLKTARGVILRRLAPVPQTVPESPTGRTLGPWDEPRGAVPGIEEAGLVLVAGTVVVIATLVHYALKREPDRIIRRILAAAVVAKILGIGMRYFVMSDFYSGRGDANRYFENGRRIAATIREGSLPAEATEAGTPFMDFLSGVFYTVAPPELLLGSAFFGLLALLGAYLCLQAFRLAVPDGDHRRYALLVLLVPTMVFWPSSLGKDAWLVFSLGLSIYGAARVLKRVRFGYTLSVLGIAAAFAVRPHIAALFALSFAAAFAIRFRDPNVRKGALGWIAGLFIVGAGAGFVAANFGEELPRDEFVEGPVTEQVFVETERRTGTGGSAFDSRPVRNPVDFAHALVTVPFRPFPTETHNLQSQVAALEGLALLALVLLSAPRLASIPRALLRQPFVAMATAYTIGFVIAFSNVANFGILTRQRAQLLPFLFVLLALPVAGRLRDRRTQPVAVSETSPQCPGEAVSATAGREELTTVGRRGPLEFVAPVADAPVVGVSAPTPVATTAADGGSDRTGPHRTHERPVGASGDDQGAADDAAPPGLGRDAASPTGRPPRGPRRGSARGLDLGQPRGRRLARATLAALLIVIPLGGGLVAYDLLTVRSSLLEARSSLRTVAGALGDIDLLEARTSLAEAEEQLETATSRTRSLRWSVASLAPVAGHSITETREVVETADAAVELTAIALSRGEELIGAGLDIRVEDGRIDLDPLLEAQALVADLPIDRLAMARQELAAPPAGWMPEQILDGRDEVLDLSEALLGTVTTARGLTTALPGFLGTEEPRRYFVGMQTSSELRGTGGLIGFWGILSFNDGEVAFGQSEVYEGEEDDGPERIGRLGGPYNIGVEADPEFHERYAHLLGTSSFSNVNLEPDLPSTARVALDLFAFRTQERLDGIILLDPVGLQRLLEATGDVLPLDPELAATLELDGPDLPTEAFAQLVTADIYEVLGSERSAERKEALRELGDAALDQVLDGSWDGIEMARALAAASTNRQLQVFSEYNREQEAFTDVGVTGALSAGDTTDLLAVTANNAVGGKQDVHLGHEFDLDVYLDDVGRTADGDVVARRTGTLEVTVDNPLPASGRDEYVIGNCFVVGDTNECFEGPPGWNWTWFNTWLPADTVVLDTRIAEDSLPARGPVNYRGLRVVDQFHATRPESRSGFEVDFAGFATMERTVDGLVYEWSWWRQSKGIPDLLDVRVHAPDGWRIEQVEVTGGGDGRGAGVHGEGQELSADVEGTTAHLSGTATAHTTLRLHLAPLD